MSRIFARSLFAFIFLCWKAACMPITLTLKLNRYEVPLNLSDSKAKAPHSLLQAHSNSSNLCRLLPKPRKSTLTSPAEITEPCLIQNLFFTLAASPQSSKIALRVDISSPWTWVKEKSCERCWESPKSGRRICKKNCDMGAYASTYECSKSKGCAVTKERVKGKINTQVGDISGTFVTSDFPLEDMYDEEDHNTIVLRNFRFLAVNKIEGLREFFADGVLGLGREDREESESGTEALEYIVHADAVRRDKRFSLHITPTAQQDFVLILGGVNEDYVSKNVEKIVRLDLNKEGALWSVKVKSINAAIPVYKSENQGGKVLTHTERMFSTLNDTAAYLSLETTFISLPEHVLNGFIKMLNKEEVAECAILTHSGGIVHCKKLQFPQHFYELSFEILFEGFPKPVSLYPNTLIKECIHRNHSENVYECFFNLHVSRNDRIVLGEAFLKNFYTVFDSENNQLLLAPPADTEYFKLPIIKPKKYGFFIYAALVLIVALILIISSFYIKKLILWVKLRIRSSRHEKVRSEMGTVRENSLFNM